MSYIPSTESGLYNWADHFSTLITAAPATYGLAAGDATAISDVVTPFLTAYDAASDPGTRTRALVATKDAAKEAMLAVVRPYAQMVKNNASVSDASKITLGLHLDATPATIAAPSSAPVLNVLAGESLTHTVRYADATTPTSRAKAAGATGMQLFVYVGAAAGTDPSQAQFQRFVSRQPYQVSFDAADRGKLVTYWARWQNAKGETGPWAVQLTLAIP